MAAFPAWRLAAIPSIAIGLVACPAAAQQGETAPSESGTTRNPATPIVTSYPPAAIGDGATTGGYNLSRWAEDWRALCDLAKRDDRIDRLKCIAFDRDANTYLTLSGEALARVN